MEGVFVYLELIHFVVQQEKTQHCKAIILQLKKKKKKKGKEEGQGLKRMYYRAESQTL